MLKRDGRKVPFNREKLERSFNIALRKRSVHENDVVLAINDIVRKLNQLVKLMCRLIISARWL